MSTADGNGLETTASESGGESSKIFVNFGASEDGNMPVGALPEGSSKRSAKPNQTIILGIVGVLAAGAIYGMRLVGKTTAAIANEVKIDYQPGQQAADEQRLLVVIKDLDRSSKPIQIVGDDVGANPFSFERSGLNNAGPASSSSRDAERAARMARDEAQRKERELQTALASCKVQGIIGGRTPVARINGNPVRVGSTVAVMFVAVEISGRSVTLQTEDGRLFRLAVGKDPVEIED